MPFPGTSEQLPPLMAACQRSSSWFAADSGHSISRRNPYMNQWKWLGNQNCCPPKFSRSPPEFTMDANSFHGSPIVFVLRSLSDGAPPSSPREPGGDAYNCLAQLLPWWPTLKSSRSLEVVGVFSKMHSFAHEVPLP